MLFLPTLLKGAGTLMGFRAQKSAARQRESVADSNFATATQNAEIQRSNALIGLEFDGIRNQQTLDDSLYNFQLAELDAQARSRNAERLRQFAETRTTQGRKALRRQKRSFEQFDGKQRAAIGASGVEFSGSALDVLAESAGQMQLAIQDASEQINFDRTQSYDQAAMEDFGAQTDLNRANAGRRSAQSAFGLNQAATELGKLSAESQYQDALFGASSDRASQYMGAAGQRTSANAGLFAGVAGFLSDRDNIRYKGIR